MVAGKRARWGGFNGVGAGWASWSGASVEGDSMQGWTAQVHKWSGQQLGVELGVELCLSSAGSSGEKAVLCCRRAAR